MPNIDTLSIQFNANGTDKAVKNIRAMGYAVRNLAQSIKTIDTAKLGAFTSSMETIKRSIPTEAQTNRMTSFSNAVKDLSTVIGSANIGGFSKDMATLGDAVNTFKKSSVNSITNAVSAMQNLQSQTQATANAISNAAPKSSTPIERGDRTNQSLSQAKELVATLDKVQIKATGIQGVFQKMGLVVPTKRFKDLENSAEKVRQKYEEVRSALQKGLNEGSVESGGTEYKKKMAELDALRNKYNELILKQRELAQEGGAFAVNPNFTKYIGAVKSGFSSVTSMVKGGLTTGLKAVNNLVNSFASRLKSVGSALKNTVTGGNSATKMAKKFANEIFRVSKMLKLMITRMALRKVIAEVGNGFKSLAIHSDEFNNSVSGMMNGAKKLGYSFAALVSPLINALAPAIVYIINLLTKLANVIQQVFGALTGATTWNKAKDFTDSWRDSIEDAGKAAKDLKKTVLGFDELNQLQENKDSSGGGSGITDMFETMKIDPKWKEFADWLEDMWKMGDFTKLGEKLGKGLRSILESIPWDKIRATSHKLGESIATLINGFVEVERLGYDIGKTIAQSVNTVFEFINGFVHRLHWNSIGKFIADTFNGFFESIDWKLIKDTVVTGMKGIADSIQRFIDNFHWDNISKTIVNGLDVISSGIKTFFENIDWKDLGTKVGDQITKTLRETNWRQIGEALGDIVQSAIDFFASTISRIKLSDVRKAIQDLLEGFFSKVDKNALANILGTLLTAIIALSITKIGLAVLKIALAEKIKALVVGSVADEGVKVSATAAGGSIAGYIIGGIVAFFAGAELGKYIGKYIFPNDAELYQHYSGLKGTLEMLKDTVVAAYDLWVMKAQDAWKNVQTVNVLLQTAVGVVVAKVTTEFTHIKGHIEMTFGEIQTKIKGKVAEIKQNFEDFIKDIKKFFGKDNWTFSGVVDGLTNTFKEAKNGIKGVWNSIAEKLNGEHSIGEGKLRIHLPVFATGGFPEDGLFMANHHELVGHFSNGKTAVANNDQIIAGIETGVYSAVSKALSQNSGSSQYIANEIIVDGDVIARTVSKAQERQGRRYSPSTV